MLRSQESDLTIALERIMLIVAFVGTTFFNLHQAFSLRQLTFANFFLPKHLFADSCDNLAKKLNLYDCLMFR